MLIGLAGGSVTAGHIAARSYEVPLQRVLWFSASLLGGDVSFAICKVPCIGPVKPDRVVRSRGRSGMGSNIAWHRRHNDSVD